jgi:hypothetical protein
MQQDRLIRAYGAQSVLQKTNRILGNSEIQVQFTPQALAPGWTDGKTVSISEALEPIKGALLSGFTPKTMMLLTSVNYHELAHILFTPRMTSEWTKRVFNNGWGMAFNVLEDQSAETRFVRLYEPAKHYFTSLVTNYMLDDQEKLENNYVLVSGRLFIPQRHRAMLRSTFARQELLDDVDRIVADYKQCLWPQDSKRMSALIEEFHRLLYHVDINEQTTHEKMVKGKPDPDLAEEAMARPEVVEDEDDDDQGTGEGDDQNDEEGASQAKDKSDDEDDRESQAPGRDEVAQALKELADEVEDELWEEVVDRIDHARQKERDYKISLTRISSGFRDATSQELAAARRCGDEFRRFQQRVHPGWHSMQRSGKLDFRRYAAAMQGSEHIYKRWREGVHDALDFEVVFCLDQSSSMAGDKIDQACGALWVLKRTFEENDGVVTVLGFEDDTHLLSQRGDRSRPSQVELWRTMGLTYAEGSLIEANRVLRASTKPLKLRVIVTDGGFHDQHKVAIQIQDHDYPTVIVGIDMEVNNVWTGRRNVIEASDIHEPMELVDIIKRLALSLSEQRLAGRTMA